MENNQTEQNLQQLTPRVPNQPTPPSVENSQPPKISTRNTWILIAVGIVVVVLLLFSSIYVLHNNLFPFPKPNPSPVATKPTPNPNSIANWKTYTNSQNGYSIKYPPNWIQGVSFGKVYFQSPDFAVNEGGQTSAGTSITLNITNNPSMEVSTSSAYYNEGMANLQSTQIIRWLSENATLQKVSGAESSLVLTTENNGTYFQMILGAPSDSLRDSYLQTFLQIANSLMLTDQTPQTDTSSWKTYINTKYGFTLTYPAAGMIQEANGEHPGSCGNMIGYDPYLTPTNGILDEIHIDNFFDIVIENINQSLSSYIHQLDPQGVRIFTPLTGSNADEAVVLTGTKQGNYYQGQDLARYPFTNVISIYKKGDKLFTLTDMQNAGNFGGCISYNQKVYNWNIPQSFKFIQ